VIVTLRQALGGNARRIHELVDELLDREDSLIVLIDGRRAISFAQGFGLSACQLEFVTVEIERQLRTIAGTGRFKRSENSTRSDQFDGPGNSIRVRDELESNGFRPHRNVVDRRRADAGCGDTAGANRGVPADAVLGTAGEATASGSG
jgi:hypothetical protein